MAQATTGAPAQQPGPAAEETIAFTRGVPAPEVLPAEELAACFAAVAQRDPVGVLQYGQPAGYLPLRRLIGEQYGVSEGEVFVTSGSLLLMDLLAAHLVLPGQTVLVEQPSYDRAISTFRRRGARVIGIPLEDDGLNVERLEAQLRRAVPAFLYVIPDFQNPSGTTLGEAKRRRLVELAEEYGFWIVEDVPYRLLRYRGTSLPLLRDLDSRRVVLMSSYSKLVAPALRVGHVVAPAEMVGALAKLGEDTYLSPVHPAQAMLYEFVRQGLLEPNIAGLKALYGPRRDAMAAAVRRHLPGVHFAEPDGGFFLSVTLPPEAKTERLLERAKAAGLLLTDGRSFFADSDRPATGSPSSGWAVAPGKAPAGERFIRLPFCAVTPQQIEAGMQRLARVLE